jgi:hypothetical protein
MLFDLTFPCYLTTFSGKKCLSGKAICAIFSPAYQSSPVPESSVSVDGSESNAASIDHASLPTVIAERYLLTVWALFLPGISKKPNLNTGEFR